VSCGSPQPQSTIILLGKTIEYRYGESVYHVTINSDSTLHWKAVAGNEVGVKADETYVAEWIDFKRLFITWGEANGTGVSQILDFEKGKVLNHLIHNREASKGEGEIRILEK
jgi:hypothetical protein